MAAADVPAVSSIHTHNSISASAMKAKPMSALAVAFKQPAIAKSALCLTSMHIRAFIIPVPTEGMRLQAFTVSIKNANLDSRGSLGYGRELGLENYMGNYGGGLGGQRSFFSRLGGGLGNLGMGSLDFGGFPGMRGLGFGRGRGMSGSRRRQALPFV